MKNTKTPMPINHNNLLNNNLEFGISNSLIFQSKNNNLVKDTKGWLKDSIRRSYANDNSDVKSDAYPIEQFFNYRFKLSEIHSISSKTNKEVNVYIGHIAS